jgi:hypothetical protein
MDETDPQDKASMAELLSRSGDSEDGREGLGKRQMAL